ncbi:hypothetical protein [Lutimonas vermicola]|uniref:Uncharacterized protein n=1 Tax=Lutimonas vermicola TaxID=414288 RepID=A0ABU9L4I5_9FLAO
MDLLKSVLFLGYSSSNDGLLFPDEIDPNEYCNSIFIVTRSKYESLNSNFLFKICDGQDIYELDLIQDEQNADLYTVNIRNYNISFLVKRISFFYIGNKSGLFDNKILYQLIPIETHLLEFLVASENIFFVGDTPSVEP